MHSALRVALAGSVVLLALAGCRTVPPATAVIGPGADAPWAEQRAALEKLDHYALTGRVAMPGALPELNVPPELDPHNKPGFVPAEVIE